MRKTFNKGGDPVFGIKIEHLVSLHHFTKALTCYYFKEKKPFPTNLSRSEAFKILKRELFFHGIQGEIDTTMYEGAAELMDEFQGIYQDAQNWVSKAYPYLVTPF